ncbi:MAG: hypothetical protein M3112_03150 [Actinomycetia bacterium]|nr:hypothetical protein [Actinomycetes bacterium]
MKRRTLHWMRVFVVVCGGALFLVLTVVVVWAINSPEQGSTRLGGHDFRDLAAEGDASCERCHFPPHYQHEGLETCSDCHGPASGDHAAIPVLCTDCHATQGGQTVDTTTAIVPLPDTTTSTTTTTLPPPDTTMFTTTLPPPDTTMFTTTLP